MSDISTKVNQIVGRDKAIHDQFQKTRDEMSLLLEMINIELRKQGEHCNAYTLTVTSGLHDFNISYLKH